MKIAVIGGIGSGKSEVLKIVRKMNIAVLSADEINAELLTTPAYVAKLSVLFPVAVKDGAVDKKALAAEVFADANKRKTLDDLAHPEIAKRIRECVADPLVVEIPLIFESGTKEDFDEIVLVDSAEDVRIKRLVELRGMDEDRARSVIKAQVPIDRLKSIATRIIENVGDTKHLESVTRRTFETLLQR